MIYKAIEPHCHTTNSDGKMLVSELLLNAKSAGYDAIALTDHNTTAGYRYLSEEIVNETVAVIKGVEWTTFFGHMVVLGCTEFIDWRFATPDNIDEYISEIKKNGGTAGIAHPFAVGSPMCTGCRWKYLVNNWNNVDYIEVWSRSEPMLSHYNIRAFNMWTDLLNRGFKIAATSGRDWHDMPKNEEDARFAITYFGLDKNEIDTSGVVDAVRKGRMYVTCGPKLNLDMSTEGKPVNIGDEIKSNTALNISVSVNSEERIPVWEKLPVKVGCIKLINNSKVVAFSDADAGEITARLEKGWARLEWYGDYDDKTDVLLGFTSPIYIA